MELTSGSGPSSVPTPLAETVIQPIPIISLTIHPVVAETVRICARENRRPTVEDFGDRVDESTLNSIQQSVSDWVEEIQKVTKLDRDASSGTALQEVTFWLNLERALLKLQEKRESPEVQLTLKLLRHRKRFHATVSFDTDTGLEQALATVNDYRPLMKLPILDLLAATDLKETVFALQRIFSHLRKKWNTNKYPIEGTLRLVEAISRDLSAQLLKILGTRRLMVVPFQEFERVMGSCCEIFNTWDEELVKFQFLLRDIMKEKRDEMEIIFILKMIWEVSQAHKKLQMRIEHIRKFRRQHEQLRSVIEPVFRPDQQTMVHGNVNEEVSNAYALVEEVEVLEISKEGQESWDAAVRRYNERVDTVEARITAALREQLAAAKSANEMFRIFARFNALFVRPQIRGAILEYQTQLIQRVEDDIETLHEKFKAQYFLSTSYRMSKFRDIPPVSGSIIWAKQIDRQLTTYLRRVEAILGSGWENHVDGQRLKSDGDSFRIKLNVQPIFEEWVAKVQQTDATVSGLIFDIEHGGSRSGTGKQFLGLKVNFLPEIITLSKEVRHLKNLGFRVPLAIMNKAHHAILMYPFAISLMESVRTYERSWEKIEDKASLTLLVTGICEEVDQLLSQGMGLAWESHKLEPYVNRLREAVFQFEENVDQVLNVEIQVSGDINSLETCAYSAKTFGDILAKIQKALDDLSLNQYANLNKWVEHIDQEVENRLALRLDAGIAAWTRCLDGGSDEENDDEGEDTEGEELIHKLGGEPELGQLQIEMMTQGSLWPFPAVEHIREQLLQKLFGWQDILTSHPRILSSTHQVDLKKGNPSTYKDLLTKLPGGNKTLERAHRAVESKMDQVTNCVKEWLDYQALWDLQPDQLYGQLGEDITLWLKCLKEMKEARSTFGTGKGKRTLFGPVAVEYGKVQSKVSLKYDSWHKDALAKFANLLGSLTTSLHSDVVRSRTDVEKLQHPIETSSNLEALGLVTNFQTLQKKIPKWKERIGIYKEGQRFLERLRFQLPRSWLHIDSVEGEWNSFAEILKRKDSSIQIQVASLEAKMMSEGEAVEGKIHTFLCEWENGKPVRAALNPVEAIRQLVLFENRYTKLKYERSNVLRGKEALEITGIESEAADGLTVALEELQDLKGLLAELNRIWEQINELKERPWLSIQPNKIREQIDGLLGQLKDSPAKLRQYASYEHVKGLLQSFAKMNTLIIELKSEALKERHWNSLTKSLHVNWVLSDLTLGQVWDVDLQKNEKILRDVIIVAEREMALENEVSKQVRESWEKYKLELINYQDKCKLIEGWDDLFDKLREHIISVAARNLSLCCQDFQEEAIDWGDKLNRILALWIDVHRRWVYLEGIFLSSHYIKTLLPVQTSGYQSISNEFLGLMTRVSISHKTLDVLDIHGVQRSLEGLKEKLEEALGECLGRERFSFRRLYSVKDLKDEDLLEIIGNSKNLQKHIQKIFTGVFAVVLSDDQTTISGIASQEGEVVKFRTPIVVTDQRVSEWLSVVEREMRLTLASLLAQAVSQVEFNGRIDENLFMESCDRFPAQLMNLAAQIWWCAEVEAALGDKAKLKSVVKRVQNIYDVMVNYVLSHHEQPALRIKKLLYLIKEFAQKRAVTEHLVANGVTHWKSSDGLRQKRFYFDPNAPHVFKKLRMYVGEVELKYGFEYLGFQERLLQIDQSKL